jgi:hypothetical protein
MVVGEWWVGGGGGSVVSVPVVAGSVVEVYNPTPSILCNDTL